MIYSSNCVAYSESWSSVIEEDNVIEKLYIDEASTECPSWSNIVREYAAQYLQMNCQG